ncbi:hypothetical protein R3P38DRAFT_2814046 [Favolaschia claudopus]|uniref:Uncharacterized protein n=1 Tax=Favolaschia claudopus TaxID=2862362 RepID=A0AAV9Z3N2_9AGAR
MSTAVWDASSTQSWEARVPKSKRTGIAKHSWRGVLEHSYPRENMIWAAVMISILLPQAFDSSVKTVQRRNWNSASKSTIYHILWDTENIAPSHSAARRSERAPPLIARDSARDLPPHGAIAADVEVFLRGSRTSPANPGASFRVSETPKSEKPPPAVSEESSSIERALSQNWYNSFRLSEGFNLLS